MPNILARLYAIGATALRARQYEMDTTADNLANINTPGFKAHRAAFQAALAGQDAGPGRDVARGGVVLGSTTADFAQGPVEMTGQTWDIAILGDGFFVLRLPDGAAGYSRLGAFHLDASQRLVNEQGLVVQPGIVVPRDAANVIVSSDGVVSATRNGLPVVLGRVQLARFPNPAGLLDRGSGIFVPSAASGGALAAGPGENGLGQVLAGALEGGNVNTAQEMLSLVQTQRAYSLTLRALQVSDQMASLTNQLQG